MNPVSELALGAQTNSPSQAMLLDAVAAQQKVIATQSGASSGDASNNPGSDQRPTAAKDMRRAPMDAPEKLTDDSQTRSIIEAQEKEPEAQKIKAAFAERREMSELLAVIRDPEDRLLPNEPEDLTF